MTTTRVLVADEHYREPPLDGGSRAVADLVRTVRELGHPVDVARSHDDVAALVDARRAEGARWRAAILARPQLTLRCLDRVRPHADAVVYLGHDLHHRRLAAEAVHGTVPAGVARAHLAMERQCWQRCDVSLYPDPDEVDAAIAAGAGTERVRWFPYFRVDRVDTPTPRRPDAPFVVLGGAGHLPNVTGLRWLLDEVVPLADDGTVPCIEVIGDWPDDRRPDDPDGHLAYVGPLVGDDLHRRLRGARGLLAPLVTGAGVKSKVIDALATATPLVTTSIGMQGIRSDTAIAWVSDRPGDWPTMIADVAAGGTAVTDRCVAGATHVDAVHGAAAYRSAVAELLTELLTETS